LKYDIIIFDFDGTIAESGPGIMGSSRYALRKMGWQIPSDDVLRKFVGPPLYDSFRNLCGMSHEQAEQAIACYREDYGAGGLLNTELYPGITPLLRALKAAGAWVAVASGKPEMFLRRIIEHLGISDCFDAVKGTPPGNHSSDKRATLLSALPEGADMSRVCMVGDRCFDVDAARLLGVHAVGVAYGYGSMEELTGSGADSVAATVRDLTEYLLDENERPRGRMITFEGTDGCGKSTQIAKVTQWLRAHGYEVHSTREPGGCPISERIREVILSLDSRGMSAECEALLYAAARVEHVKSVILPALREGKTVLCDRFLDSSIAYQAYGRELGEEFIRQINKAASDLVTPDCTLQFDIDREAAKARLAQGAPLDRLEEEKDDFFRRVAEGYDSAAKAEPGRIRRIDSGKSIDEVFADVLAALEAQQVITRG